MMLTNRPIDFHELPRIPDSLRLAELHLLVPKGFEEIVEWEIKHESIVFRLLNTDMEDNEITIEPSVYAPENSGKTFPKFLFEISSLRESKTKVDYFKEHSHCIINQNELLYMILQHRLFVFLDNFKNNMRSYGLMLRGDIQNLNSFCENTVPKAYNEKQKMDNTVVILSPWDLTISTPKAPKLKFMLPSQEYRTIGEVLRFKGYKPTEKALELICQDLPIHPSSESAFSETGKLVVAPYNTANPLYRSVGYKETGDGFISLFKPASNIVARLKTHLISSAIELANPDCSVIAQDCLYDKVNDVYVSRDNCLRKSIVVFARMNKTNNRFVAGEIEASRSFVDTKILRNKNVTDVFLEKYIKKGELVDLSKENFLLGINVDDQKIEVTQCDQVKCLNIVPVGILGAEKIRLQLRSKAGNARIDSNTGIKGVTKCKPNLGKIVFDNTLQALSPDLVVGMNAVKAKTNTMAIAAATLAVELGFYKPNNKWGILDSLNEDMVNAAIEALPKFTYYNEFGKEEQVRIGIVYTRFTELGSTYGKFKPLSFMFETGRFLNQNGNKALQEHIWKNYVDPKVIEVVKEFTTILEDPHSTLMSNSDLPVISAKTITQGKVFTEKDFIYSSIQTGQVHSKFLDSEWNSKGFYVSFQGLNLKYAPIIRIPSASILNEYANQLPDLTWSYHPLIVRISNILRYCLPHGESGYPRYTFVFDPTGSNRYTELKAYLGEIHKLLYQGNEAAE